MKAILDYLSGVRAELTHVKWPSTGQAVGYTALVILISLVVAGLMGGFDYLFRFVVAKLVGAL